MKMHGPAHSAPSLQQSRPRLVPSGGVDGQRPRMVGGGEQCMSEPARSTGVLQPTLSQQLGVLRDEGLVATRRDGKFIHYRLASARAMAVLELLYSLYCPAPPAGRTPHTLKQGAPR